MSSANEITFAPLVQREHLNNIQEGWIYRNVGPRRDCIGSYSRSIAGDGSEYFTGVLYEGPIYLGYDVMGYDTFEDLQEVVNYYAG